MNLLTSSPMKTDIELVLEELSESGNLRRLPEQDMRTDLCDLSSNDYLGIGSRSDLRKQFFSSGKAEDLIMTSSASRLLASRQNPYSRLEQSINTAYGHEKRTLLHNSGYHANTGLIPALASIGKIFIIADRLVHASIIDGIRLSGVPFTRFRHNDYAQLDNLAAKAVAGGMRPLIITESIYSMDGDCADIDTLVDIKRRHTGAMLYIDEAHAFGAVGEGGLGLCRNCHGAVDIDVIVGTFGKAYASAGAFSLSSHTLREFFVNRCRSLIFSTALAPLTAEWTNFIFELSLGMDSERSQLKQRGIKLAEITGGDYAPSHIRPYITGDPKSAVEMSARLRQCGFNVLPIRRPTVPPGTDRLRFSLSAALTEKDMNSLSCAFKEIKKNNVRK